VKHQSSRKRVLLLVNLGTPSAPTPAAVRAYLAEFLSDPRIVAFPAYLGKSILKSIILSVRSQRSARLYQSIWLQEGSPLAVYTGRLTAKVQKNLGDSYDVVLAMRYGQPSLSMTLKKLLQENTLESLIVLPLYPQYSAATTGSCFDVIAHVFKQSRFIPTLHFIASYFANERYIATVAETIRQYWIAYGTSAYLLFSFHGLPQHAIKQGDPYEQQCYTTADLLAQSLQLSAERYRVVFQSRFGKTAWLQPHCDIVLQQLPVQGIKQVAVICPGFAVDCLETLEEMSQRYRNLFLTAGGESFHYIPALNDSLAHSELLANVIQQTVVNH
jgi:protoporphyrin/coproporphyrin ferrochelatase